MIVRPWTRGDTEKVALQPAQQYMYGIEQLHQDLQGLSDNGLAWTVESDGVVIGIAGLAPQWENRAIAWALLSQAAGPHLHAIHKATARFLDSAPFNRIEANVDIGFDQGHRWMKLLGFEIEGYLRAYRPDGADMTLYSRIKKWHS